MLGSGGTPNLLAVFGRTPAREMRGALMPETGQMSARTDALVSQQETGKITASIVPRCGRLPPGMSFRLNADSEIMFRVEGGFPRCR